MDDARIEEIRGRRLTDLLISEMTFPHNQWITTRIRNVLQQNGIHTLDELLGYTEKELLGFDNFGAICLAEVKAKLDTMGLKLKEESW